MKFLTWNIQSGGGKRIPGIVQELQLLNPDFIVLTEVTAKNNATLQQALAASNYRHVFSLCPPANEKSVMLASKTPFKIANDGLSNDQERWVSIEMPDKNLKILGVHIPGATDNKFGADGFGISGEKRKERFWTEVIKYAEKSKGLKTILLGDFNTGLREDAEGTPFKLSEFIVKLRDTGFVDTWRHLHPNTRDYTWYWRRKDKIDGSSQPHNGFRLDYVFVSPLLRDGIVSAQHVHHVREQKLSDHSIVMAEVNV